MQVSLKRTLRIIAVLIVVIMIGIGLKVSLFIYSFNNIVYRVSPEDMIKALHQNRITFLAVAEYLKKTPNDILIRKNYKDKIEFETFNNDVKISANPLTDEQIMSKVNLILYKINFGLIQSRTFEMIDEEGNGVFFRRGTDFRHCQGIAYSKDGKAPNDGFVKYHRALGNGWYYFEGE